MKNCVDVLVTRPLEVLVECGSMSKVALTGTGPVPYLLHRCADECYQIGRRAHGQCERRWNDEADLAVNDE